MLTHCIIEQVHCIRVYEMKDYERGIISLDQPRYAPSLSNS